jgi:hypothetical protein
MKKISVSLVVIFCLCVSSVFAQQPQMMRSLTLPEEEKRPTGTDFFELGTEIFYLLYQEPGYMENKGFLYGLVGTYEYHNRIMLGLESRAALGQVDYDSENTGSAADNDEFLYEGRLLLGYDIDKGKSRTTPFIGFGYRYLFDDSSGSLSTTGAAGYTRHSNYLYSPIGIKTVCPLEHEWTLNVTTEFDIFWFGKQFSEIGDALPGHPTVENEQNEGLGFRTAFDFVKEFKSVNMSIGAFYRFWWVNDSETDSVVYNSTIRTYIEPRNRTHEIGGKIAIQF